MRRSVEARVTGRVQGVSFRFHAQREAERLGVAGWVRNDPDGTVAAYAEGEAGAVQGFVAWLHDGPPAARVDRVEISDVEPAGATSFDVRA